jgi:hypothetical protein
MVLSTVDNPNTFCFVAVTPKQFTLSLPASHLTPLGLYVPVPDMQQYILETAHSSAYSLYPSTL